MRVLAVNQFYLPDHSATSQLLGELCEDLVHLGETVDVIAGRGTYLGGQTLEPTEIRNGVRIHRPWATSLGKRSAARRMADYLSFWSTSLISIARAARPDVILSLTTPPMITLGAAGVAKARRVPLVSWVQDVYPDVAVELGVLSSRSLARRALSEAAKRAHRATSRIVVLSEGMAGRLVEQGAPPERIRVIQNWADGSLIRPIARESNRFLVRNGLTNRFVVMYSGNLGAGHDLATLIGAARLLERPDPRVVFVFVGDGARRREAEVLATGLGNVMFLPYQAKSELGESLSGGDVHLISLRQGLAGLIVPSKLYGILAAGRATCYVGPAECEVARVVRENDLGWVGAPGDSRGLARAIARLAGDAQACSNKGHRARSVFIDLFDRPVAVRRWRQVLLEAAGDASA